MMQERSFGEYRDHGHLWITLSNGEYYPDILVEACELYQPVLVRFGQLLKATHSSTDLLMRIADTKPSWMRIQLCRVFRKYVSPNLSVEMLKKKRQAGDICARFGDRFRKITEVQRQFEGRADSGRSTLRYTMGVQRQRSEGGTI